MAKARETTVEREASLTGISLHSGAKVRLTVKPAGAGTGYQFRRMDLADQPVIPAFLEKVKQVERATTLAEGSVKVSTVEHLLSALRGLDIDNALIELDANEPPIGDGSAAPFLDLLSQAGRKELDAPGPRSRFASPFGSRHRTAGIWPPCRMTVLRSPAPTPTTPSTTPSFFPSR